MRIYFDSIILSTSSVLYAVLTGSLLLILLSLLLLNRRILRRIGLGTLCFFVFLIIFRLTVPLEYTGISHSIYLTGLPVSIFDFLNSDTPLTVLGNPVKIFQILLFFWITGSIVKGILFVRNYRKMKTYILHQPYCTDERVLNVQDQVEKNLSVRHHLDIRSTSAGTSPCIGGFLHPVILLPQMERSDTDLYYTLLHETAHYKRGDFVWKFVLETLGILYWWNPFIFLLKRQMDNVLEFCVDDFITRDLREKEILKYMECIYHSIEASVCSDSYSGFSLKGTSKCTHMRFELMSERSQKKRPIGGFFLCLIAFLFMFCIIIEPYHDDSIPGTFTLSELDNAYIVQNDQGTYDLYINDSFLGSMNTVHELLVDLPVYTKEMERIEE